MTDGREYTIENVWDFAQIPDDRLDLALKEFAVAVRMSRETISLLDHIAVSKDAPKGMFRMGKSFQWIDDDLGNVTIGIKYPDTSATHAKPNPSLSNTSENH